MAHPTFTGQDLKVWGDEVHHRQTPGPQENWQDSVVIVWYDESNGVGGFQRMGHEPNVKGGPMVTFWNSLQGPLGMQKKLSYKPLREEDKLANGGFGSGDDSGKVEFINGEHIWTINEGDVTARLVFKDTGPNVDCFPKRGEGFVGAHFDIPGTVTGSLTMKGKEYNINGRGVRDHGWGPRNWVSSYSHRWVAASGKDLSFIAVSWHAIDDRMANFGWVIRGDKVEIATKLDILTYTEIDAAMNRGGHVKFTLPSGEVLDIECTPYPNVKASICWHHGIACVDRLCSWECNGMTGFCDFETTSNMQMGSRRPSTFVDGVIDDGWTPYA